MTIKITLEIDMEGYEFEDDASKLWFEEVVLQPDNLTLNSEVLVHPTLGTIMSYSNLEYLNP